MTAAHCALAMSAGAVIVYGTTNLTTAGLSVTADVAGSIVHQDYGAADDATRSSDISVLTLASSFSGVQPARVAGAQLNETVAAEFGWGDGSPVLRISLVRVVPRDVCIQQFGMFPEATGRRRCVRATAGALPRGSASSGTPETSSCQRGVALSVFTNLSYNQDWIQSATFASETCGGNSTCIGRITSGVWSETLPLGSGSPHPNTTNAPGAVGGPPAPNLRTMIAVANSSRRCGASLWILIVLVATVKS